MPRRRKASWSSGQLKQQTLLGFLSSSPPSSPSKLSSKSPSLGPSKKRKRTRKITSSSSSPSDNTKDVDSDVGAIRFEPEAVEVSDEDRSPRRPKQRRSLVGHPLSARSTRDDSEPLEESIGVPRYHRKGKNKIVLDSEDDARPLKRKLIKGIRPPTPEEDDDDILDAENQVLESRLRSRGKTTAFQRNLEKLKSKKRGELVIGSSTSEAEQSESSAEVPFKGARPHHSEESGASHDETDSSQEDEDDFIVNDDTLGIPAPQLPLAFSLSTHQDLTHHFKIICQLFVHMAVRPLADRRLFLVRALKEEEYLSVPLQVARRKLSGMRDSLVASSVWDSNFKKVLETYPNFTLIRLTFAIPQCDACHLGGRLSTLLGRLSGKPYNDYDFEDVSDDESDETSEEDEDKDEDSDADEKRDTRKEFHLGRFCAARTKVYHQFCHWEHSLYKSLQREIMEAQDRTHGFVKVAFIGGIKPPRDLYDADKVMEWLDQRGIIEMEWQKVREMMDSARNLERGGGVDDYPTGTSYPYAAYHPGTPGPYQTQTYAAAYQSAYASGVTGYGTWPYPYSYIPQQQTQPQVARSTAQTPLVSTAVTAAPTVASTPRPSFSSYTPTYVRETGPALGTTTAATGRGRKHANFKGLFTKELKNLMYGFGDDRNPATDTVNVMEEILVEFIVDVCQTAGGSQRKTRLSIEDLRRALSRPADAKKLARMEELLFMQEDIKRARAQFEESDMNHPKDF